MPVNRSWEFLYIEPWHRTKPRCKASSPGLTHKPSIGHTSSGQINQTVHSLSAFRLSTKLLLDVFLLGQFFLPALATHFWMVLFVKKSKPQLDD